MKTSTQQQAEKPRPFYSEYCSARRFFKVKVIKIIEVFIIVQKRSSDAHSAAMNNEFTSCFPIRVGVHSVAITTSIVRTLVIITSAIRITCLSYRVWTTHSINVVVNYAPIGSTRRQR